MNIVLKNITVKDVTNPLKNTKYEIYDYLFLKFENKSPPIMTF